MSKWGAAAAAAGRGDKPTWMDDERANDGEWLEAETKRTQKESVNSTRRALNRLNEAQQVGAENLNMLNHQSEQLHRIEKGLDETTNNAKAVDSSVNYLKSLNKYFFLPAFGEKKAKQKEMEFNKMKEEESYKGKHVKQREKQWAERNDRIARQDQYGSAPQRREYHTTPAGLDRDDDEREIDNNLGEISSGLARLKMMGMAMNDEMDMQSEQMRRINERSDKAHVKVEKLNNKVDYISNGNRRRK
jgi:hypothetical protein